MGVLSGDIDKTESFEEYELYKKQLMYEVFLQKLTLSEDPYLLYLTVRNDINSSGVENMQELLSNEPFMRLIKKYLSLGYSFFDSLYAAKETLQTFDMRFEEDKCIERSALWVSVKEIFDILYGKSWIFPQNILGKIETIHIYTITGESIDYSFWNQIDRKVPIDYVHVEDPAQHDVRDNLYPDELKRMLKSYNFDKNGTIK